jgi:hypothetical protein
LLLEGSLQDNAIVVTGGSQGISTVSHYGFGVAV